MSETLKCHKKGVHESGLSGLRLYIWIHLSKGFCSGYFDKGEILCQQCINTVPIFKQRNGE